LWETPEGRNWLIRLIVATLLMFGLKRGVGADTMSEFFGRLHLEAHVGCSPSALRSLMRMLEQTILETAAAWEQQGIAYGEIRPIIGAVDETFLQRLMLVFMDLASGYLLPKKPRKGLPQTGGAWPGLGARALLLVGSAANQQRPDAHPSCRHPVYLGFTLEESPMAEQVSAFEARAQLYHIVERLTDEEVVAIWRLVCSWVAEGLPEEPAREDSEEHP
jgi:hypothetical protein